MQIQDYLKKKFRHIFIICIAIIADVIPIIAVMAGLWIVKYFSKLFGFEGFYLIQIISTFSELFMIILYIASMVLSLRVIYMLFKEEGQ
jgi:hypothetical protein